MVEDSPVGLPAPLLRNFQVMAKYASVVTPSCPPSCSCHFYHFAEDTQGEDVSYTVRVDCSGRNLTTFPSLPSDTTVLDLSYNLLDQASMNVFCRLSTIDMKLFKLK